MKIHNLNDFITPKQAFSKLPDMPDMSGYESPITMNVGEMQTKMEADTMSVIQHYGIDVNKEELIKALAYDREQYEKGYQDACNNYNLWNNDLISRDALKKAIEEYKYCGFYDKVIEIIDNAPSINPCDN